MTKKQKELSFYEKIQKIAHSGISGSPMPNRNICGVDEIPCIDDRIKFVLQIVNNNQRPAGNMLFFVMYDIESNKVRHQIVKYLLKKGCTRVQKSIFLSDLPNSIYDEIKRDLTLIQSFYENDDSIIVVPISSDYLNAMKIIGHNIDIDVITKKRNTLFF
jgi:CRISPR-associated endonuclease Cas2